MIENDDLMKDFASYIEARARKKHAEAKKSGTAGPTEDENLFNATVGLRIKCGVCGSMHKSSRVDVLPGLKTCINKLVETFKTESRRSSSYDDGGGKLHPEWTKENTALMLRETITNRIDAMMPGNSLWTATHPKFLKKVSEISERINEMFVRHVSADVPMQEILGAPNSVEFVRVKLREFRARMVEEQRESAAKQLEMAGDIAGDLTKWRSMPIEKWKVSDRRELGNYDNVERIPEPIDYITVNGEVFRTDTILVGCFTTVHTDSILWQVKDKTVERYVIDMDLWKDEMPALLWNARAQQGYKERSRRSRARHGKPIYGLSFLSTWSGKVYLIHGMPKTVKHLTEHDYQMNEIVPRKRDKDI